MTLPTLRLQGLNNSVGSTILSVCSRTIIHVSARSALKGLAT
jgi:hypothetical protein